MEWNVAGHEWAAQLLQQHIARSAMRQAYLFSGPPGVGRRTLALRFAQALNCPEPPAPGEMCAACRTCRQIERMQYADLSVVELLPDKAEISIDQIRALQHSLSLAPREARFRVALLLDFDTASLGAQNALLKTLEEAQDRAILLLRAESAEDVLPTIASRCELLRLRPMSVDHLENVLRTSLGYPADEARRLAHLAGGRMGYARRLHEDANLLKRHMDWLQDLHDLLREPHRARIKYVEKLLGKRNQPVVEKRRILHEAFPIWLTFWRDVLLAASGTEQPLTNLEQTQEIQQLAGQLGLPGARNLVENLMNARVFLDENANPQLLLDTILLDWPRL